MPSLFLTTSADCAGQASESNPPFNRSMDRTCARAHIAKMDGKGKFAAPALKNPRPAEAEFQAP